MQYKIINSINNGNVTDEQIKADTKLSPNALRITIEELISSGIIGRNEDGSYFNLITGDSGQTTTPTTTKNIKGDIMEKQNTKTVQLTTAQAKFKRILNSRKGELRDQYFNFKMTTGKTIPVTIRGAGNQKAMLVFYLEGLSEFGATDNTFYLAWNDSTLESLHNQVYEFLGIKEEEVTTAPVASIF